MLAINGGALVKGVWSTLQSSFARESIWTFGTQMTYAALMFITSVLLAHVLGVAGYGIYAYAMSWQVLLQLLAAFGTDQIVIRQVVIYRTRLSWPLMKGV